MTASTATEPTCRFDQITKNHSEKVAWRILRMFRDITWLSRLPQNEKGGAYAGNAYYMKKWKCADSTVRYYRQMLKRYGLIKSAGRGPNVLDIPLVSIEEVVTQLPFFYRLFQRLLPPKFSGFLRPSIPITTDKEENSNMEPVGLGAKRKPSGKPKEPLPAEAACVVVSAANAGVSEDAADTLVRELGAETVRDAVELALFHRSKEPQKAEAGSWGGGWIRTVAQHLKNGTWKLPAKFLEQKKRNQAKQHAHAGVKSGENTKSRTGTPASRYSVPSAHTPPYASEKDPAFVAWLQAREALG